MGGCRNPNLCAREKDVRPLGKFTDQQYFVPATCLRLIEFTVFAISSPFDLLSFVQHTSSTMYHFHRFEDTLNERAHARMHWVNIFIKENDA